MFEKIGGQKLDQKKSQVKNRIASHGFGYNPAYDDDDDIDIDEMFKIDRPDRVNKKYKDVPYSEEDFSSKHMDDFGTQFFAVRKFDDKGNESSWLDKRHDNKIRIKIVDIQKKQYLKDLSPDEFGSLICQMKKDNGKRGDVKSILGLQSISEKRVAERKQKEHTTNAKEIKRPKIKKEQINEVKVADMLRSKEESLNAQDRERFELLNKKLDEARKEFVENDNKIRGIYAKIGKVLGKFFSGRAEENSDQKNYSRKYRKAIDGLKNFEIEMIRKGHSYDIKELSFEEWTAKEEGIKKEVKDASIAFDVQEKLKLHEAKLDVSLRSRNDGWGERILRKSSELIERYRDFEWKKQVAMACVLLGISVSFFNFSQYLQPNLQNSNEKIVYHKTPEASKKITKHKIDANETLKKKTVGMDVKRKKDVNQGAVLQEEANKVNIDNDKKEIVKSVDKVSQKEIAIKITKGGSVVGAVAKYLEKQGVKKTQAKKRAYILAKDYFKDKIPLREVAKCIMPGDRIVLNVDSNNLENSRILNVDSVSMANRMESINHKLSQGNVANLNAIMESSDSGNVSVEIIPDRKEKIEIPLEGFDRASEAAIEERERVIEIMRTFCAGDRGWARKIVKLKKITGSEFNEIYVDVSARIAREIFSGSEIKSAKELKEIGANEYIKEAGFEDNHLKNDSNKKNRWKYNAKIKALKEYVEKCSGFNASATRDGENLKQWIDRMVYEVLKSVGVRL